MALNSNVITKLHCTVSFFFIYTEKSRTNEFHNHTELNGIYDVLLFIEGAVQRIETILGVEKTNGDEMQAVLVVSIDVEDGSKLMLFIFHFYPRMFGGCISSVYSPRFPFNPVAHVENIRYTTHLRRSRGRKLSCTLQIEKIRDRYRSYK